MTKRIKDPASVAEGIVVARLSELTDNVLACMEHDQFAALVDALAEELPNQKHVLTLDEDVALSDRLQDALPDVLKKEFFRFHEWNTLKVLLHAQAGFLMGLEMGRRVSEEAQ